MTGLVGVGFLAFFVVALVVGVRVLLMARRTHGLPEICMGLGVLGIGPVGFGLMVAARQVDHANVALYSAMLGIAFFAMGVGTFANFVFNWRVYHPGSKLVRAIVILGGLGIVTSFMVAGLTHGFRSTDPLDPSGFTRSLLQIACLLWSAGEAFFYWTKMRLRVRVGLADPVVSNRFLMWAIATFAAGWGTLVGFGGQIASGSTVYDAGWVMVSSSMHGLVSAIAIALAFLPPRRYLAYIRSRA
jgi:hypothetical protein